MKAIQMCTKALVWQEMEWWREASLLAYNCGYIDPSSQSPHALSEESAPALVI